jgi:hypothetical protein
MSKTVTTRWDPADHLVSSEDMAAYLEAALEDGNPKVIAAALGDSARAKGMHRSPVTPVLVVRASTRLCQQVEIQSSARS